jgi:hypothetical protein
VNNAVITVRLSDDGLWAKLSEYNPCNIQKNTLYVAERILHAIFAYGWI